MTVQSSKYREAPYACNGSVIDFAFTFRIFSVDDLRVYLTDDSGETLLTYGTHYDVIPAAGGLVDGGTVRTVATYPAGSTITLMRQVDIYSLFDVEESGSLPAEALEAALDRITIIAIQLAAKLGQCVALPILEENTMELPALSDRLGKFLYFEADGSASVRGLSELGAVTADESTLVLSTDVLSIKDGGVNLAKLAQDVLDYIAAEAGAIVDIHDAAANPHPGKFEGAGTIDDHEAASNPHSQYARIAEDFVSSQAASGYQKLPGGLIIQWGIITSSIPAYGVLGTVTFPIAFPAAAVFASIITDTYAGASSANATVESLSTTQLGYMHGQTALSAIYWIAIGY